MSPTGTVIFKGQCSWDIDESENRTLLLLTHNIAHYVKSNANDSIDAFSTSPGPLKLNKGNLSFQSSEKCGRIIKAFYGLLKKHYCHFLPA